MLSFLSMKTDDKVVRFRFFPKIIFAGQANFTKFSHITNFQNVLMISVLFA